MVREGLRSLRKLFVGGGVVTRSRRSRSSINLEYHCWPGLIGWQPTLLGVSRRLEQKAEVWDLLYFVLERFRCLCPIPSVFAMFMVWPMACVRARPTKE